MALHVDDPTLETRETTPLAGTQPRDEAKKTVYIASVREWITDQISVPVGNEETVQLLEGKTVKIATRDGLLTIKIQMNRSQNVLILDY